MKKILITGGSGFIARNLFEQLSGEYNVVSCGSRELDLLDPLKVFDHIKGNSYDVVIHTATYDPAPRHSTKDPTKVLENNLAMFFNVARCKDHFGKMIYFGSGAEYDRRHWTNRMNEDYFDRHVPKDQYGFSKYIMTKYALLNSDIYNLRVLSVFGKYEDWRYRFISRACCRAILNMPIIVDRNASYDFLYIDDLVNVVKWFIDNKPKENVYNVCAGRVHDFKTLADKIIKISNKKLDIVIKTEECSGGYGGDNSLLLSELKNFEFSQIDRSIADLYRWYDSNKHIIKIEEL